MGLFKKKRQREEGDDPRQRNLNKAHLVSKDGVVRGDGKGTDEEEGSSTLLDSISLVKAEKKFKSARGSKVSLASGALQGLAPGASATAVKRAAEASEMEERLANKQFASSALDLGAADNPLMQQYVKEELEKKNTKSVKVITNAQKEDDAGEIELEARSSLKSGIDDSIAGAPVSQSGVYELRGSLDARVALLASSEELRLARQRKEKKHA